MNGIAYTRYELLRTFRNRRFLLFSLGFALVFFWLIAAPQHSKIISGTGLTYATYYVVLLASFGTMMSMISTGARIAGERQAGWTRQLRISPLSVRAYFRAKVLTGYGMALSSLLVLYISGSLLGVSLPAGRWLAMTGLIVVGLLPFAALGVLVGHREHRLGRPADGRTRVDPCLPQRHMVRDHERLPACVRAVPPLVVARPGAQRRARRPRLGRPRLDHCGGVDGDSHCRRRLGVSTRHGQGLGRAMAIRSESRLTIASSVPEVWAYVCDVGRWPEWAPTVRECWVVGGAPLQPGSRVEQRAKGIFGSSRYRAQEVTEVEAPRCVAFAGPMGTSAARWGMELEPIDGRQTEAMMWVEVDIKSVMRAIPGRVLNGRIRRVMDLEMAAIKAAVESATPGGSDS